MGNVMNIYRGFDLTRDDSGVWTVTRDGNYCGQFASEDDAMKQCDRIRREALRAEVPQVSEANASPIHHKGK